MDRFHRFSEHGLLLFRGRELILCVLERGLEVVRRTRRAIRSRGRPGRGFRDPFLPLGALGFVRLHLRFRPRFFGSCFAPASLPCSSLPLLPGDPPL